MSIDVCIYSRVSTAQQNDEGQISELLALCERNRWHVAGMYRETCSGVRATDERPALRELLAHARRARFSKVIVWTVDRLGRSMPHLMKVLGELRELNVDVLSFKQAIDTSTTHGAVLWQLLGIFAELEHGLRAERQALGIIRARNKGVRFGRPPNTAVTDDMILALQKQGLGINKIAATLKVGSDTVRLSIKRANLA